MQEKPYKKKNVKLQLLNYLINQIFSLKICHHSFFQDLEVRSVATIF